MTKREIPNAEIEAVLAEREACAKIAERAGDFPAGRNVAAVVAAAIRSRPSLGPATETERKDGWWVTPEWRQRSSYSGLYLNGLYVGGCAPHGDNEWMAFDGRGMPTKPNDLFPTREEAQDALLASVRPKQEGV